MEVTCPRSCFNQEKCVKLQLTTQFKMLSLFASGLPWWFRCQCRRLEFDPWVGKIPWRRKVKVGQSYLTLCDPREYTVHGILINGNPLQRSCLENAMDRSNSPWGCKELDMTERPHNNFPVPHSASGTLLSWVAKP